MPSILGTIYILYSIVSRVPGCSFSLFFSPLFLIFMSSLLSPFSQPCPSYDIACNSQWELMAQLNCLFHLIQTLDCLCYNLTMYPHPTGIVAYCLAFLFQSDWFLIFLHVSGAKELRKYRNKGVTADKVLSWIFFLNTKPDLWMGKLQIIRRIARKPPFKQIDFLTLENILTYNWKILTHMIIFRLKDIYIRHWKWFIY